MTSTLTTPVGARIRGARAMRCTASSHAMVSARRVARAASTSARDAVRFDGVELETDARGNERVRLREDGWNTWTWRGHACNYISAGESNDGPIVTLVHGFGAHSYHWRYTIPALARAGYRVYALCMLGYGWSPKVEEEYCMEFWGEQVVDFSREVAGASEEDKTIIVGNSIGALAALYAASTRPLACKGLCLVNSAGNFEPDAAPGPEKKTLAQRAVGDAKDIDGKTAESFAEKLREAFSRGVAAAIFYSTKFRIKQILNQVYEYDVDDDLVRSIDLAAQDPGAIKTFYQLSLAGSRTKVKAGDLLRDYDGALMLLWGEKDPWMTPTKASRIREIKPNAVYSPVIGGHCPHDDCPRESNAALLAWADALP
jgi:pimeloyl-ACP methyl ester carboxylesterase